MKYLLLTAFTVLVGLGVQAQEEPSKNLPPLSMLPKDGETKKIYELPSSTDYEVFNAKGEFVTKGNGQFIDCSKYAKGVYFIRHDGKTVQYHLE